MKRRWPGLTWTAGVIVVVILRASPAAAQPAAGAPPAPAATAPLEVRFGADIVRDLPYGENVFAMLEATLPEAIADGFNSGGLNAAGPARVGAFLTSWSRAQYRVGAMNISSPLDGGPLLFPETAWWAGVGISTGLMSPGATASGLVVSLDPFRAAAAWTGVVEVSASGGGLVSAPPASRPPPIARLDDRAYGSALASRR
jgi:hypothetical protein